MNPYRPNPIFYPILPYQTPQGVNIYVRIDHTPIPLPNIQGFPFGNRDLRPLQATPAPNPIPPPTRRISEIYESTVQSPERQPKRQKAQAKPPLFSEDDIHDLVEGIKSKESYLTIANRQGKTRRQIQRKWQSIKKDYPEIKYQGNTNFYSTTHRTSEVALPVLSTEDDTQRERPKEFQPGGINILNPRDYDPTKKISSLDYYHTASLFSEGDISKMVAWIDEGKSFTYIAEQLNKKTAQVRYRWNAIKKDYPNIHYHFKLSEANSSQRYTQDVKNRIVELVREGKLLSDIAKEVQRTQSGIRNLWFAELRQTVLEENLTLKIRENFSHTFTQEMDETIISFVQQGKSIQEISRELNVPCASVRNHWYNKLRDLHPELKLITKVANPALFNDTIDNDIIFMKKMGYNNAKIGKELGIPGKEIKYRIEQNLADQIPPDQLHPKYKINPEVAFSPEDDQKIVEMVRNQKSGVEIKKAMELPYRQIKLHWELNLAASHSDLTFPPYSNFSTEKDRFIAKKIDAGWTYQEIADELSVDRLTVTNHWNHILKNKKEYEHISYKYSNF